MATRDRPDLAEIDRSSGGAKAADDAIGGYFGLEIPQARQPLYPDALRFQSASAALRALLDHLRPPRLWMPRYICPPLVDLVRASGVRVAHYALEEDMRVDRALDHGPNDAILCVDYFGVSSRAVDDAISRFGAERVIVDAAHALFRRRKHELAAIYSPRKFVGLPDGGLLATDGAVPIPGPQDEGSLARTAHLLLRLGHQVEEGYEEFRNAEASLVGQSPKRMSRLTSRLLDSIDFARIARRQRMNYAVLSERLANTGEYTFPLPEDAVPLCFAVVGVDADAVRKKLFEQRIYTPVYWTGLRAREQLNAWEQLLCNRAVFLPCDQRYGHAEMIRLADAFTEAI